MFASKAGAYPIRKGSLFVSDEEKSFIKFIPALNNINLFCRRNKLECFQMESIYTSLDVGG